MRESPTALLVGQAEIDRVERVLDEFRVDYERVPSPRPGQEIPAPTGLLVVSGHCISRMPDFVEGGGEPVRVCIHAQDFLPLRERLRELGFHYLVQSALDEASLRVFLSQLLHPGEGHRASARLPLGGRVEYRSTSASGVARLADLSAESCRILGAADLRVQDPATVVLPGSLGGGKPLALHGHVIRSQLERAGDAQEQSTVVRFGLLDDDARERLGRLVGGELIGARVTPLAEAPGSEAPLRRGPPAPAAEPSTEGAAGDAVDRRREVRHPYRGRVDVLEVPGDADGALGRDLSLDGVCISSGNGLKPGMKVTLALFGGQQPGPVVVQAEAIRVSADEAAMIFGELTDEQQDKLACLIAEQPAVESLDAEAPEGRIVPTRILRREG